MDYKIKRKSNGSIKRYKACLVILGTTHMEGMDYHKTFAPVAKIVTIICCYCKKVKSLSDRRS